MSNVIGALFGNNSGKAAEQAAQAQEAQAQSDQGQQLRLLSQQQAQSDDSAAAMSQTGLGRALLAFSRPSAGTLGGAASR